MFKVFRHTGNHDKKFQHSSHMSFQRLFCCNFYLRVKRALALKIDGKFMVKISHPPNNAHKRKKVINVGLRSLHRYRKPTNPQICSFPIRLRHLHSLSSRPCMCISHNYMNVNYVCTYLLVCRWLEAHTHYQNAHFTISLHGAGPLWGLGCTCKFEAKSQKFWNKLN